MPQVPDLIGTRQRAFAPLREQLGQQQQAQQVLINQLLGQRQRQEELQAKAKASEAAVLDKFANGLVSVLGQSKSPEEFSNRLATIEADPRANFALSRSPSAKAKLDLMKTGQLTPEQRKAKSEREGTEAGLEDIAMYGTTAPIRVAKKEEEEAEKRETKINKLVQLNQQIRDDPSLIAANIGTTDKPKWVTVPRKRNGEPNLKDHNVKRASEVYDPLAPQLPTAGKRAPKIGALEMNVPGAITVARTAAIDELGGVEVSIPASLRPYPKLDTLRKTVAEFNKDRGEQEPATDIMPTPPVVDRVQELFPQYRNDPRYKLFSDEQLQEMVRKAIDAGRI